MTAKKGRRPYKQVARAQATQRTRETLLQAASEEVERDGWERASLESVAERAGVTKQTALRHFGSKKGLLDAVLSRTSSIVVKERDESPVGDIPGAVANLVRHYERYGELVTRLLPYRDAVVRVLGEHHRESFARRAVDRGHEVHEQWVLRTFEPQLSVLNGQAREQRLAQLVAVCDVYMWKILRMDLGLSILSTEAALIELIERLVEPDAGAGGRERRAPSRESTRTASRRRKRT
jgi:AcrR family transcriptional regulator